jgi:hypothetical protein
VRDQLSRGYTGGAWTGAGIISSTAANAATLKAHRTATGHAVGLEPLHHFPATFPGGSGDSTTLLMRHTLAGGSDLSGAADLTDFTFLAANFNQSLPSIPDAGSLGLSILEPASIAIAVAVLAQLLGTRRRCRRPRAGAQKILIPPSALLG